ncbi:aldose epimerase family protein [Paenibacillus sp. FSL H8-0537]|uniref:aldose epimerase family protein n=1 Tax=Paenibacillus sp. FSL H8-0537 TaxID=2921399 RepID=UPI00310132C8
MGKTEVGEAIYLYSLTNSMGMQASIMTYGGIMLSLKTPDRNGIFEDIVLGYPTLKEYINTGNKSYFGAIIGRYANRIANGRFTLDGTTFQLSVNDNPNTLHGGKCGFNKKVWKAEEIYQNGSVALSLSYWSKNGEEGFPGNLDVNVIYTLTDSNELKIDYAAVTDTTTVVNLTQHNYYNLAGEGNGNILGHILTLHADRFTPVNPSLIPTGKVQSVEGTPLDFRKSTPIGARIHSSYPQMKYANGYDFNYVLNGNKHPMIYAASVYEPTSGRVMEVYTTQPAVQFYSGNQLDGSVMGKRGRAYPPYAGFCLETQHYPNSPNEPDFPSTELLPGHLYRQSSIYKFSVM